MIELVAPDPVPELTPDREAGIMQLMSDATATEPIGVRLKKLREAGGISAVEVMDGLKQRGHFADRALMARFEAGKTLRGDQFVKDYFEIVLEVGRRRARALGIIQ